MEGTLRPLKIAGNILVNCSLLQLSAGVLTTKTQ